MSKNRHRKVSSVHTWNEGNYTKTRKGVSLAAALTLGLLVSVVTILLLPPLEAHMPGASTPPEFELQSVVISDGGTEIEITIHDVGNYHNECMKQLKTGMLKKKGKTDEEIAGIIEKEFAGTTGMCPCTSCAFRSVLLGISRIWGDEIPERGDIKVITRRPTPGATQCLQYITGTAPDVPNVTSKGDLQMILPDGSEVTDLSVPSLKKHMKDMGIETWNFIIVRKSTGEEFEVQAVEDVVSEGFDELRGKVKIEGTATEEETKEFRAMWEEVRDAFLTQPDWELFEGIKRPFPLAGAIFLGLLVVGLIIIGGLSLSRGEKG